jgi:hypothetical protein
MMESFANARIDQNTSTICPRCSWVAIEKENSTNPSFNALDPDDLKRVLKYGGSCSSRACVDCGSRMHPALFVPTTCYNCDHLIFCDGKLQHLCEHCEYDYVARGAPGSAAVPTQSAKSVERDLENKIFQYMDLMGGGSKLFGNARNVSEGRRKFLNAIRSFYSESLGMRFTPRHLLYLLMLKFGQNPDGSDGLVVRDFIPHKSVPGAGAEDDDWEDLWIECPDSLEKLEDWVKKNCRLAEEWPEISEKGVVASESALFRSLDKMLQIISMLMPNFESDCDQTGKQLKKLGEGVRPDAVCTIEHKIALTFFTFGSRAKEQADDFSIDRRYQFETEKGWSIRLFHSERLPAILQNVTLPFERSSMHRAEQDMYNGKFNDGGLGLSRKATRQPNGQARPKPKKSGRSLGCDDETEGENEIDLNAEMEIVSGVVMGDRVASESKCKKLHLHRPSDRRRYCLRYQYAGCMHGDLDCERVHELVEGWPAELTNGILQRGGHLLWNGLTL